MKTRRKILRLLLCGVMLFSLCAQPVFAEVGVQDSGQTVEAGTEEEPEVSEGSEITSESSEKAETAPELPENRGAASEEVSETQENRGAASEVPKPPTVPENDEDATDTPEGGKKAEETQENAEDTPEVKESGGTVSEVPEHPETQENSGTVSEVPDPPTIPENDEAATDTPEGGKKAAETQENVENTPEVKESGGAISEVPEHPENSGAVSEVPDPPTVPENDEDAKDTSEGGKKAAETQENAEDTPEVKESGAISEVPEHTETQENSVAASEVSEHLETKPETSKMSEMPENDEAASETPEEPEVSLPGRSGAMRAAARASEINMQYDNFVFAQGIPIVIKQNGIITSVYSAEGNLLSGNTDVSGYAVYGGWYDGTNEHDAYTSVTMESGTIKELFGGSYSGTLTGNTSVVVNGGEISNVVCGGGNQSVINGSTEVQINGGTIGTDSNNSGFVYGGGFSSKINGSTSVTINNDAKIHMTVFGGTNNESVESTKVILNGGNVGWVYGGGYAGTVTNGTSVEINGGTVDSVYGGDNTGSVAGGTSVTIGGTAQIMDVYGGGYEGEVTNGTSVEINGGTVNMMAFGGGGYNSTVYGGTNVRVNGGTVGSVYGGGDEGAVAGGTSVTIDKTAQIADVYGGGYLAHVDDTKVEIKGGTMTSVYGGGNQGAVTGNTSVTVTGGKINDSVYGGSNEAAVNSSSLVFAGGTANQIYGGGFGNSSSVETANVELKGGDCEVYGGGRYLGSTVKQATVTLGTDWGNTKKVFAGGSFGAVTNASQVIILNYATQSGQSDFLSVDAQKADDSEIVVRRNEGGPLGSANTSNFNLTPTGVKRIGVEYGEVTLLGRGGLELKLDSLDIQANGQVRFQDWDTVVIQKLSGSGGQLLFPAQFASGTANIVNRPVEVGQISATAPLIIKAEGSGWGDNLEKFYFFHGSGVDALTSADCFFSEGYEVVLREIPDKSGAKGVYLQKKEAEKPVYISKLEFNQNPVAYNGTISLTVGVGVQLATADYLELIPSARIQIRGSNDKNVLFADIQVSEDGKSATVTGLDGVTNDAQVNGGYITFELPVNADLLDTCQEGLSMIATAPNQYSSTAQLVGPIGETQIEITPAPINLTNTIPEPDFQDPVEGKLEDGSFYTADFRWHQEDGSAVSAFVLDRDYRADIVLTPKEGHWLSAASIGNTVIYDDKEISCVFNADGTATLKDVKNVRFVGYRTVVNASPTEGGTVAGGGNYAIDSQVTVKAQPAEGWHFVEWTKDGNKVSTDADYTFTVTGNHTFVAIFEQDTYTVTVQTEGSGTASATPSSATAGTTVTLTATADSGYHFKEWQVITGGVTISGDSFTMPDADVIVKAVFEQDTMPSQPTTYTVTVQTEGNGTASATPSSATAGTTVTLTATADSGYHFKEWQVVTGGVTISSGSFIMPDADVTVKAVFEQDATPPQPVVYTVTVQTEGNGTASATPSSATAGTTVTLTATADSGCHFKEWQVVTGGVTISGDSFTMPDADVIVKAVFEQDATPPQPTTYTVTMQTEGNGTASATPSSATAGTTVTLTATADSGYHFKEWQVVTGGVAISGDSFTMPDADVTVKAVFEQDATPPQPARYSVTVNGSYAATSGAGSYEAGTTVSVYAGIRSNYRFDGWTSSDGIDFANAGNVSTTFTMPDKAVTVTANWTYTGDGSGGDTPHTPSYEKEDLTDSGVTLSGAHIHEDARLTVTKDRLHDSGDCGYCVQIRRWQKQGRVLAIYDVSLSHDFRGTVTLTFPVPGEYNGKTLTVVHCLKDKLDTCDVTVSDGKVTVTVDSLSPFVILDNSERTNQPDAERPQTGGDGAANEGSTTDTANMTSPQTGEGGIFPWEITGLCVLPAALLVGTEAVIYKRRRKAKAETSA